MLKFTWTHLFFQSTMITRSYSGSWRKRAQRITWKIDFRYRFYTNLAIPIEGVEIVKGNQVNLATWNVHPWNCTKRYEEVINKLSDKSQHLDRIAVAGGGYIGVELAEAFERLGKKLSCWYVDTFVLNGYYDKDFTQMMAKNLKITTSAWS